MIKLKCGEWYSLEKFSCGAFFQISVFQVEIFSKKTNQVTLFLGNLFQEPKRELVKIKNRYKVLFVSYIFIFCVLAIHPLRDDGIYWNPYSKTFLLSHPQLQDKPFSVCPAADVTYYVETPEMRVSILSDGVGKPFSVRPTADDDLLCRNASNGHIHSQWRGE